MTTGLRLPAILLCLAFAAATLSPAPASPCCGEGLAACKGASPCNACRNCKSCKHCKGGATCGTCSKAEG